MLMLDDRRARHGGIAGEITRPEQAMLLRGDRHEEDGSAGPRCAGGERARDFDQGCDARRIVHGAVVDAVATHRGADADVIEVCRQNYVLAAQGRIASRQQPDDVVGLD
jgi:hypothetical protein